MNRFLHIIMVTLLTLPSLCFAQYDAWQHSGSLFVLTTPEGADVPADASVKGFPVLVRLHRDFFDFSQARAQGEDLRFSTPAGVALPYQIDAWDAVAGTAAIWVRLPEIAGNTRQEIRMHWGKADAVSASNGKAVFNASNGYLSVWHMGDFVEDEVGTLQSTDTGTTVSPGIIGMSRRLSGGKGVNGGEQNAGYPTGAASHSTEAWFRAEAPNATILGWGNEKAQGKVVLKFASPPHVRTDCYFSNGNVKGDSRLPMGKWVHVMYAYENGNARLYINGQLDGVNESNGSPLAIKSPSRLYIGGWYNRYQFTGDIDEVRVSQVARSAQWAKLQYENQKPMQTLVGPVVQPGDTFSVSPENLTIAEGHSAIVSAQTEGAQKVYWVAKRGDGETVLAVDRNTCSLEAGRVRGDESWVLQLRAVYPDGIKTRDIPVTIREAIPEPVFTLQAPGAWNGRDRIEVVPVIQNADAMHARGADDLGYTWNVSGGAVIKEEAPDKLILKRSQCSGKIVVTLSLSNGGDPVAAQTAIAVTEPESDPWVARIAGKHEKPLAGQFYGCDARNEGTLYYNGILDEAAEAVFLKVYADDKLYKVETQKPAADRHYAFSVKLRPGLVKYKVVFGSQKGSVEQVLHRVDDLVCGHAYLIDGQSNALATDTRDQAPPVTHQWIRSYGRPKFSQPGEEDNLWCYPVWKARNGEKAELGWWGMELAKQLVETHQVPICMINGAVGGTRIDQHQRNPENPTDLDTIYGRLLWRVRAAKLTHQIRAVIWHQGENDQGAAGPDGGYGWETYQRYFVDMSAAWKEDFPNIQKYYLFQIWPNACSMGGGNGNMLREQQRTLSRLYSNLDVMSTLGIRPGGGCHYPLAGWAEFARLLQPLIDRDFYGVPFADPITPPDLQRAFYTGAARDTLVLQFDQPVVWEDSLTAEFYLDGEKGTVESGSATGNLVTLKLKEPRKATTITYLNETAWKQENIVRGQNGLAALTFCNVLIEEAE